MKNLILMSLIIFIFESCTPTIDRPRYTRSTNKGSIRRGIPKRKQETYRNPTVKDQARRTILFPNRW